MKREHLPKYEALRSRLRSLPGELRRLLGDAPPIRVQLFEGLRNEVSWFNFSAANYNKLPKEMAAWEDWKRLPYDDGYCRFFGLGSRGAIEKLREVFEKGDAILFEYDGLCPVLEELEWRVPGDVTCPLEGPDYMTVLRLIAYTDGVGYWDEDNDERIVVDGMELVHDDSNDPIPFMGPPEKMGRLQRVGLSMLCVDDVALAFENAVDKWLVPYDRDWVVCQLEKAAPPVPDVPVVESVTVALGEGSYRLLGGTQAPLSIPFEYKKIFGAFVAKMFHGAAAEPVAWAVLHDALSDLHSQDVAPGKASDPLRKALSTLRSSLAKWGRTPDGQDWILTKRGTGVCLNTSLDWQIDPDLRKELTGRSSASVWGLSTDPKTMEASTSKELKRQHSQRLRKTRRDDDVDE